MDVRRSYLRALSRALPWLAWPAPLESLYRRASYRVRRAADYRSRPDDVFVVSFPKSGTTLLQMMLYQMTTDGSLDIPHIDAVCPWFESDLRAGAGRCFEALPSPRIFKSHLRRRRLPATGRFLYIARDLHDVAIASYHHVCLVTGKDEDFEPFVGWFLSGRGEHGTWFAHLESWWPHRNDPDVLFLLFDEVVADPAGTARRIARFCGLRVDERHMPRIVERCGLGFMKRHGAKLDPRLQRISRRPEEFFREGRPGSGRRELTAAQRARLRAAAGGSWR
ncbi:MAG TPA: sulfotransferase domain-containing protein [Thermoanaerobaculia bacterium]